MTFIFIRYNTGSVARQRDLMREVDFLNHLQMWQTGYDFKLPRWREGQRVIEHDFVRHFRLVLRRYRLMPTLSRRQVATHFVRYVTSLLHSDMHEQVYWMLRRHGARFEAIRP